MRTLCVMMVALIVVGCEANTASGGAAEVELPGDPELRAALLDQSSTTIMAAYAEVEGAAGDLRAAVQAWSDEPSDVNRVAAQQAFGDTAFAWQVAEAMVVGPAGIMSEVAGGQDLRDAVYSWPLVNPCRVDQVLVSEGYADAGLSTERVNARGLDALEYLLFAASADHSCPPNLEIATSGGWDSLGGEEVARRRRAYALAAVVDLERTVQTLKLAWSPDGGDFAAELREPRAGSTYPSQREALNALSDALFYLDKEVKDMKVAVPAGISDCLEASCPDRRESRHADRSLAHIRANLVGFARLYRGGDERGGAEVGFDDLLRSIGAERVDEAMESAIAAVFGVLDSMAASMMDALQDEPQKLEELHDRLKELALVLRTEFVTILDLDLPSRAEGDND